MFIHVLAFLICRIGASVVTSVVDQWKSISSWCKTSPDLHTMAMLLLTKLVLLDSKVLLNHTIKTMKFN